MSHTLVSVTKYINMDDKNMYVLNYDNIYHGFSSLYLVLLQLYDTYSLYSRNT